MNMLRRLVSEMCHLKVMVGLWCMVLILLSSPGRTEMQAKRSRKLPRKVFGFQEVIGRAKELAGIPYQDPSGKLPEFLVRLNYDQWRDIRFIPEKSLWRNEKLPFEVQFFHPGFYYDRSVVIHIITPSGIETIPFSSELFDYGANDFKYKVGEEVGFAGFRIHYDINQKNYKDEFVVFLGASYFRAVARGQGYGISGRGIAVNTALPSGEEFPYFKEYWIHKPGPYDAQITVYALLDSPSLTGAYHYLIKPGKETVMEVEETLFFRNQVNKLGVAPLNSMFFYGENTNYPPADDFRPEVHDSDGLLISFRNGEWLWRPLVNPTTLRVHAFQADNPLGFGLMQRDLSFDHYQDLETHYELRPSVWVQPRNEWGKGCVELIQIPSKKEIHDNIVAFWKPGIIFLPGDSVSYAYTMSWCFPPSLCPPGGKVVATREAEGDSEGNRKFVIDFEGKELNALSANDGVEGVVTVESGARLLAQQVFKNTVTGGWRLVFQVRPEKDETLVEKMLPEKKPIVELRAFLKRGMNVLTETWSYGVRF